jgi:penicillin-binding protein 1A
MKVALKDKQPVGLPGHERFRAPVEDTPVAGAGEPRVASANAREGGWTPPAPQPRRSGEKNFLERLFGL